MMLFKKSEPDEKLDKCHVDGRYYELFMFPYQEQIQMGLVITAVLMIPIMLLGKPILTICKRKSRRPQYQSIGDETSENDNSPPENSEHEAEESFGDLMVLQSMCQLVEIFH